MSHRNTIDPPPGDWPEFERPDAAAPLPASRRGAALPDESTPADPAGLLQAPVILLAQPVYRRLLESLTWPPETGGLLIGPKDSEAVTHFHLDGAAQGTAASLTFDHVSLNEALARLSSAGLDCKGYAHAHPPGCDRPSLGDLAVMAQLFAKEKNRGLRRFLLPIVCGGTLHPFVVERGDLEQGEPRARPAQLLLF